MKSNLPLVIVNLTSERPGPTPAHIITMSSLVSLADFIKQRPGRSVNGRVKKPGYPANQDLALTVRPGWSNVSNEMWMDAIVRKDDVSRAKGRISRFITQQETRYGDTSRKELEGLKEHVDLLQ
jgi:hypothetical protein